MIRAIIEEHALEAAALFEQRHTACHAPDWDFGDLLRNDERVEAHLDGLRLAGRGAASLVHRALGGGGQGELFVAALLALESGDRGRVRQVVDAACAAPALADAFAYASAWLPEAVAAPWLAELARSRLAVLRRIALVGTTLHRADPGAQLRAALADVDTALRARGLWAAGELGDRALLPAVLVEADADELVCRVAACSSAALLGPGQVAAPLLRALLEVAGPHLDRTARIAGSIAASFGELDVLCRELASSGRARLAAIAAGAGGFAASLPHVLDWMRDSSAARVAGEAFTLITGRTSPRADLGQPLGPTDDPDDEDVAQHPDEGLAVPDPDAAARACDALELGSAPLLLGRPRDRRWLIAVLRTGRQRERWLAARCLAAGSSCEPLFDVCHQASVQQTRLSQLEPS